MVWCIPAAGSELTSDGISDDKREWIDLAFRQTCEGFGEPGELIGLGYTSSTATQ